jgi:hypothetical protein
LPRPQFATLEENRGNGALRSATLICFVRLFLREWGKPQARWRTYRLAALRFGVFLTARGRAFREGARKRPLRQPCSRQATLVSPGGAPTPPRVIAANDKRRRRPLPASYDASRERPRLGMTSRNIVSIGGEVKNFVIPGRCGSRVYPTSEINMRKSDKSDLRSIEPGIQSNALLFRPWIPDRANQVGFTRLGHFIFRSRVNPRSVRVRNDKQNSSWPGLTRPSTK